MAYALFNRGRQIGKAKPTELEVWKYALETGLISDVPVADEEGGQVLPAGLRIEEVEATDRSDESPPEALP